MSANATATCSGTTTRRDSDFPGLISSVVFIFAGVSCGKAPRIVEHPTNTTVGVHEPATLNCKSDGQPQPGTRWFRDGRPVDVASSVRKALLPDGSLLFLEAAQGKRDSDSGTYWCIAFNTFGEAVSRKVNLVVTCEWTFSFIISVRFPPSR